MNVLIQSGLDISLKRAFNHEIPILGICLGTQIILSHSEEGDTPCLDIIEGKCIKFQLENPALKIPHIGWNAVSIKKNHPILNNLKKSDEVYFVHSFYPLPALPDRVYATAEYEIEFPVAIGYKNLFGTQFHPEKSGPVGLQILKNFSEWDGTAC
jgi:glutamine amidotransferase